MNIMLICRSVESDLDYLAAKLLPQVAVEGATMARTSTWPSARRSIGSNTETIPICMPQDHNFAFALSLPILTQNQLACCLGNWIRLSDRLASMTSQ